MRYKKGTMSSFMFFPNFEISKLEPRFLRNFCLRMFRNTLLFGSPLLPHLGRGRPCSDLLTYFEKGLEPYPSPSESSPYYQFCSKFPSSPLKMWAHVAGLLAWMNRWSWSFRPPEVSLVSLPILRSEKIFCFYIYKFIFNSQGCTLCPIRCGPMKKLKDGNWVHVICNIFVSGANPCRPCTIDVSYRMGKFVRISENFGTLEINNVNDLIFMNFSCLNIVFLYCDSVQYVVSKTDLSYSVTTNDARNGFTLCAPFYPASRSNFKSRGDSLPTVRPIDLVKKWAKLIVYRKHPVLSPVSIIDF